MCLQESPEAKMQEAYEQKKKEDLDAAKKAAYDEVSTHSHTYMYICMYI
jgi:hypothetical protein